MSRLKNLFGWFSPVFLGVFYKIVLLMCYSPSKNEAINEIYGLMMIPFVRKRFLLVAVAFSALTFTGTQSLQAQMVAAPTNVPDFMPTQGWHVQPTVVQGIKKLPNVKLPCMAKTVYDNGYELRLSGSEGRLLAMAVDFRQNIFARGRQYPSTIVIPAMGPKAVTATAFSNSVLIFNLRNLAGIYQVLPAAPSFELNIEGNIMRFGTGGLSVAMAQLESCFQGRMMSGGPGFKTQMPPPVIQPAVASVPPVQSVPMDDGNIVKPRFSEWEKSVSKDPYRAEPAKTFKDPVQRRTVWQAKAGDDLQQTLQRWGSKAGVDIAWQAGNNGTVANDVYLTGTFEDAVQSLMAQNAAALGIQANMQGAMPAQPISLAPTVSHAHMGAPPAPHAVSARWSAKPGDSLRQVLTEWSRNTGVDIMWQSNTGFRVKRPVSANGSYEAALQSLLQQYQGDSLRPAVQLNNDPVTGERVLFVQSTRVL